MDTDEIVLTVVIGALVVVMGLVIWWKWDEPSCEDLGGHRVFSHFQPIFTGKVTTLMPIYRCEGAR